MIFDLDLVRYKEIIYHQNSKKKKKIIKKPPKNKHPSDSPSATPPLKYNLRIYKNESKPNYTDHKTLVCDGYM